MRLELTASGARGRRYPGLLQVRAHLPPEKLTKIPPFPPSPTLRPAPPTITKHQASPHSTIRFPTANLLTRCQNLQPVEAGHFRLMEEEVVDQIYK